MLLMEHCHVENAAKFYYEVEKNLVNFDIIIEKNFFAFTTHKNSLEFNLV